MQKTKILIVASFSPSLIHFRGDFIKSLIAARFQVYTAAPDYPILTKEQLNNMGAIPLSFKLERTGINPLNDINSIMELKSLMKQNEIDVVFPYTVKPVIYSSIAANLLNIPVISLITGLGFTFTGLSRKAIILQRINEFLYKNSIRKNKLTIFQNKDDYKLFLDRKILTPENKVDFVNGSGVNLDKYRFRENDKSTTDIKFLFVARLIKEKGVDLFIEAAKVLKVKFPDSQFHIIGEPDQSPSAINITELNNLHADGIIIYHGKQNNVEEHLYNSDVFVLPTYYREGVPRSILEALSVGLPIITTDSPGCRETVKFDYNGILIKPQNQEALTNAMLYVLEHPEKVKIYGIHSRAYAKSKFDVDLVNNKLITLINTVISSK
ncbi:glycosyltransferase family 4 protein [Formosa sp. 3Alg 14/1]|uniref:glycosyltransferase family 4 protein n=1 Tax=Formosa sp. 3Alg 14/1 TaxID=3382190 RepID=UPI0039BEBDAC